MTEPSSSYRIDYSSLDVVDLMSQVRERAREQGTDGPALPTLSPGELSDRLRDYLLLDDSGAYAVQQRLGLQGDWNVSPEDLRASHAGGLGALIAATRRALRPLLKLFANADLPLYKQFKVNLGLASAVQDLLQENDALRRHVGEVARRLERLEEEAPPRAGHNSGHDPGSGS